MYLWNVRELSIALDAGRLSEYAKLRHFLVLMVFWTVVWAWNASQSVQASASGGQYYVAALAYLFILSAGNFVCFYRFHKSLRRHFLEYALVMLLPISIRIFVITWAILLGEVIVDRATGFSAARSLGILYSYLLAYGGLAGHYVWLYYEIDLLARKT